jgi:hypothetical protein
VQTRTAETSRLTAALSYAILLGGILTIALSLYIVVTTCSNLSFWDDWTQIEVAANGRPVSLSSPVRAVAVLPLRIFISCRGL